MRVLLISNKGDGLGIAWNMLEDGHDVYLTMDHPGVGDVGKGLYHRHKSWRPLLNKVDFIICDGVGMGSYENIVRGRCKAMLGGSFLGDVLNKRKERAFLDACDLTKCPKFGHTVRIYGLFNGRGWLEPAILCFNEEYMFPGGLGLNVGSMGGVYMRVSNDCRLVQESLMKVTDSVKRLGLSGIISLDVRCNSEELGVLGVQYGISHDISEVMIEGLREPLIDVLFGTAAGIKERMDITNDFIVSVRVTIPPWPYAPGAMRTMGERTKIEGINEENAKHLHMIDVYRDEGDWLVGRSCHLPLKATARGRNIREARRRVYRTLDNINIEDMQYRLDIGSNVDHAVRELKGWGLI